MNRALLWHFDVPTKGDVLIYNGILQTQLHATDLGEFVGEEFAQRVAVSCVTPLVVLERIRVPFRTAGNDERWVSVARFQMRPEITSARKGHLIAVASAHLIGDESHIWRAGVCLLMT